MRASASRPASGRPLQAQAPIPAAPAVRDRRATHLPFDRRGTSLHLAAIAGRAGEPRRRDRVGAPRRQPVVMHRRGPGRGRRAPALAVGLAVIGDRERLDLLAFVAHYYSFHYAGHDEEVVLTYRRILDDVVRNTAVRHLVGPRL